MQCSTMKIGAARSGSCGRTKRFLSSVTYQAAPGRTWRDSSFQWLQQVVQSTEAAEHGADTGRHHWENLRFFPKPESLPNHSKPLVNAHQLFQRLFVLGRCSGALLLSCTDQLKNVPADIGATVFPRAAEIKLIPGCEALGAPTLPCLAWRRTRTVPETGYEKAVQRRVLVGVMHRAQRALSHRAALLG